jgi:hypothetical protein
MGPNAAALKAATAKMNLRHVDEAGPMLEAVLWQTVKPNTPMPADLARRAREPQPPSSDTNG